ncbi:MAG: FAD-dependent oxidoreductase [Clostridia bacterium]|nr:FAD-dependent oxidoreductase [Clostridia bacterium]
MKVAIIGAGVSGLSCAIELERHGITPVIFEKTKMLGDKPGYLVATLRLFHRSLRSPMSFLKSKYDINLSPLHPIKEITMTTPNKTVSTKANHGYIFSKGIEENSVEHQLAAHLDSPVMFDTDIKIQDIKKDYAHIVVATGDNKIADDLNLWNTTFAAKCRIAAVTGSFDIHALKLWLNKSFANNGYAYLLVKSICEAEIILAVSDIAMNKLDYYWNEFLIAENIKYPVIKQHDIDHMVGYPSTNQFENIYFIGNCGGMMDDFLGFGMLRAIESGILAARAIVNKLDYNKLLTPFKKELKSLTEYRKLLNVLTNKDYDMDMSMIGLPVLKHMIYNNPLYKAKYGVLVPKVFTYFKKKNHMFTLPKR